MKKQCTPRGAGLSLAALLFLGACGNNNSDATEPVHMVIPGADGSESVIQMGGAQIKEEELGIPFYPGATVDERESTRLEAAGTKTLAVVLRTEDDLQAVAEFYRKALKNVAPEDALSEKQKPGGLTLDLARASDGTLHAGVQIVQKKGSELEISVSRGFPAPKQ